MIKNASNSRFRFVLLTATLAFIGCDGSGSSWSLKLGGSLIDKIEVAEIDLDLDQEEEHPGQLLWENFANRPPESLFSEMSQKGWRDKYAKYTERLLLLAEENGFDAKSLKKAIEVFTSEQIENKYINVPVAAYRARYGEQEVWIILVKWEWEGFGSTIGHIRMGAFTIPDCELVSFSRCS